MPARLLLVAPLCASLIACTGGRVGTVRMQPMAVHADAATVRVHVEGAGDDESTVLADNAARSFARITGLERAVEDGPGGLRLELRVTERLVPASAAPNAGSPAALLAAAGSRGAVGGLTVEARLYAPGGAEARGFARWRGRGAPEKLAEAAGAELGAALGRRLVDRRREHVERRAVDERLLLTPTPQTLRPGSVVLSNDELLLFRAGVGLSRRVQLDFWLGGFPLPSGIGGAVPAGGLIVAGAGSLSIFGFFDLGLKVRILDEGPTWPGVAISYDLLDLFGGQIGGGGIAFLGKGAAGAGYVAVGGSNVQLNVFALSAAKHFGRTQVTAGTYVVDNHNILPQKSTFRSACGRGGTGVPGTGGIEPCLDSDEEIPRLPTQLQPFLGVEHVFGPVFSLMAELLPRAPFRDTMWTTGARWLIGPGVKKGLEGGDHLRVRLDLAMLWLYAPPAEEDSGERGKRLPLPWIGLAFYFQGAR